MKNTTDLHLTFFWELQKRRNEIESFDYIIFKEQIDNSYKESAILRSGLFMLNSHYEWFVKKLFQDYLDHIYKNNKSKINKIFYYDTIDKINQWRVNNIPFWKLEKLMKNLNLSFEDFLENLENNLFNKLFFKKQIKKLKLEKEFYHKNNTWDFCIKQSLKHILDKILIYKRNQIWHWDLIKISKNEFKSLKIFILWFFWILLEFIIDNSDKKTYLE